MKYATLVFFILFSVLKVASQTSVADGDWGDSATWAGAVPSYEDLSDIVIDSYVISNFPLTFTGNHRKLQVFDTLIVYGDVSFTANSGAAISIGPNNILIIFGNLDMGKNHAGIEIGAGGMLIVTGNISSTGTGGSISGEGTVYTDGTTSGMAGNNGGGQQPINQIDETEGGEKSPIEEFVLGGGAVPLPVELLYFKGKVADAVLLTWSTASEYNNEKFEIQRSEDGIYFYQIAEIAGAGDSKNQIDYSYRDWEFHTGVVYYRLRQVDFDGVYDYSKVIRVNTGIDQVKGHYRLYPTIATGSNIRLYANKPFQIKELIICDLRGHVQEKTFNYAGGSTSEYHIQTDALKAGTYILKVISTEGEQTIRKFIVK